MFECPLPEYGLGKRKKKSLRLQKAWVNPLS